MKFPRVVITGMGCLTPVGKTVKSNFENILQNKSNFQRLSEIENLENPKYYPLEQHVSAINLSETDFQIHAHKFNKTRANAFLQIALLEALDQSNVKREYVLEHAARVGVSVGSLSSNITFLTDNIIKSHTANFTNINRFTMMNVLNNILATTVSVELGTQGPTIVPSTACATGLSSIGEAFNLIRLGYADMFICGGAEEVLSPASVWGPLRLGTLNSKPINSKICAPFDFERNGIILGEAGAVVIIETIESAIQRSANILGEIIDFGMSSDGLHFVKPDETGNGPFRALKMAGRYLKDNKIAREQIIFNAHATGTKVGDRAELGACDKFANELEKGSNAKIIVTANKGNFGHCFSAAGIVETIMGVECLLTGNVPPVNFFEKTDVEVENIEVLKHRRTANDLQFLLKNSFGFGGVNCALLIQKYV